jgi:membrane protein YqaA with SNARE-associated domain
MEGTKISARVKYILLTGVVVITTVLSVWLMIHYWREIVELQQYGYLGVFGIALIAGSSIPTPISYMLVTFTMGGILHPALVGLCAGVGAGMGGTLVFFLGKGGRHLLPGIEDFSADERISRKISGKLAKKFNLWAQKRGSIVVFLMSAMFNPVFAPMAITMGALRFKTIQFMLLCTAGNILKALVISYAGYLGVGSLLRLFGGA